MTGAELKQLREDLGEAIGRPLSVGDMAKLCGLPPETGPATIVKRQARVRMVPSRHSYPWLPLAAIVTFSARRSSARAMLSFSAP